MGVEHQRFRNEKNMSPVELKDKKPFSGLIFLYLFRFGQTVDRRDIIIRNSTVCPTPSERWRLKEKLFKGRVFTPGKVLPEVNSLKIQYNKGLY